MPLTSQMEPIPWFIANTMEHLQIAALELEKVLAVRTAVSQSPVLALCTTGTKWFQFNPTQGHYKNTRNPPLEEMPLDWRLQPLFLEPKKLDRNCMQIR